MDYRCLIKGNWEIWGVVTDRGRCPYEDFYNDLRQPADKKKIAALLKRFAFRGPPVNTQKFRKVNPWDIWELKPTDQIRFLGFFPSAPRPDVFVITHGFRKQQNAIPRREIDKARAVQQEWAHHYEGGGGR